MCNAAKAKESLRAHLSGLLSVDWDFVESTLRELPVATEASTRGSLEEDAMGRALLIDILAKDPFVEIVDACLRAFPDSLHMNVSAYFTASLCRDLNVIRRLVRLSLQRQTSQSCPYPWMMMSHVSAEAADAIIQEYPQGVLQPCDGSKYSLLDRTLFSVDNFKLRQPDPSWWDKLILMLKVAEHGSAMEEEGLHFHPIHFLVQKVVARREFFKNRKVAQLTVWLLHQLSLKYPCLFRTMDGNGDAPLHVALRASCIAGPGSIAHAKDLVAILVDAYNRSASIVTHEGRLPLFVALENGWPCHDVLVRAAPHSLHRRDPITCLYPFQVAACSKPSKQRNKRAKTEGSGELDLIYDLLRQDPLQARGSA